MLGVVDEARTTAGDGHAAWSESFNEMLMQVAGMYSNARVRRRGRAYLLGLLSRAERKNSWQLAEFAGDASPDGIQRLLNFSPRDEAAARDALGRYVVNAMGDPAAVPAVDETGFLKRGRMSAGVARMYTGPAGRVENCQVGVFAAYVTPEGGRALIDRELYLPKKWTADPDRCRAAAARRTAGAEKRRWGEEHRARRRPACRRRRRGLFLTVLPALVVSRARAQGLALSRYRSRSSAISAPWCRTSWLTHHTMSMNMSSVSLPYG